MGCLKRIFGFGLFLTGLVGCLFYLPTALFALDPSVGGRIVSLWVKVIPALTSVYNEQAFNAMWGSGSPLMMFVISAGVLFLGMFLAK